MIARRIAAAGALALAATASVPALASAAPVQPTRALLTAAEFPSGSSQYTVMHRPAPTAPAGAAGTSCDAARERLGAASAGGRSTEAVAYRDRTYASVELTDRPLLDPIRAVITACTDSEPGAPTTLAVPRDVSRYGAITASTEGGTTLETVAEVRGITIQVLVDASPDGADHATFWELLRAQIAKVERQP
ncbi:hypothetical protein AXK56_02995 [Tsukamurella pulmonis]|uniref:PknH-like extracellular domain-containing protein n=1 Tax=Tsukamurella pulmonis TaxID=47312 RepID=A0A1H1E6M2_9ACTN|nr:hypothetical protein [Tsukamurella pulmonis]KXO92080.1 hypothetical protein AXK56_02995 [Tsukamurella pulmonis]SDQ83776.1 hypothetical protein SAMN04489765_2035 [Tsukamurella pulmonis]SUP21307.1 Uncharacterised protein [Tsukamurella pulmonis]